MIRKPTLDQKTGRGNAAQGINYDKIKCAYWWNIVLFNRDKVRLYCLSCVFLVPKWWKSQQTETNIWTMKPQRGHSFRLGEGEGYAQNWRYTVPCHKKKVLSWKILPCGVTISITEKFSLKKRCNLASRLASPVKRRNFLWLNLLLSEKEMKTIIK